MAWPNRLSFNHYTALPRPFDEWFDAALRAGVSAVGLNRQRVEEFGYKRVLELVRAAHVPVTTYASLGFWASGADPEGRPRTADDNLRNLDQAAELGAEVVSVTSGGLAPGDRDIRSAQARVIEGVAELIPHAVARNLKLGMEPLHPIFCPTLGIWTTLGQTLDIIDMLGNECLGLILDVYHSWWEPDLVSLLRRAVDSTFLVQLNDWSPALVAANPFNPNASTSTNPYNRALMGEGVIDFDMFLEGVKGYTGWFDVETTNDELRSLPIDELLVRVRDSYERVIEPRLSAFDMS